MAVVTTQRIRRISEGWELPLQGTNVAQCTIDAAITLRFETNTFFSTIRIEGDLQILVDDGVFALSPGRPEELGPVLGLLNNEVVSAYVTESGTLEVTFTSGQRVVVLPDPNYEAWEFASCLGARIVSLPRGGITVWSERP